MAIIICLIICVTVIVVALIVASIYHMEYCHDLNMNVEMDLRNRLAELDNNVFDLHLRIEELEQSGKTQ
mgnify:CR=1 FL=1